MSAKILIADDSATILKVISITLASSDYEVSGCLTEQELFEHLDKDKYDMVLLDFTLSEDREGYDLIKDIKAKDPSTSVFVMLGAFDPFIEEKLTEAGAADRITKPFDSERFLRKCTAVLDSQNEGSLQNVGFENESDDESFEDASWEVDSSNISKDTSGSEEEIEEGVSINSDELSSELSDWGLSVPGVIGKNQEAIVSLQKPPVIDDGNSECLEADEISKDNNIDNQLDEDEKGDSTMTDFDATAAFTIPGEISNSIETVEVTIDEEHENSDGDNSEKEDGLSKIKLSSKLVSLDDLSIDSSDEDDKGDEDIELPREVLAQNMDDDDMEIESIPIASGNKNKIDINDVLKDEIEDDISPEEVWSADSKEFNDRRSGDRVTTRMFDRRASFEEQQEDTKQLVVALTPVIREIVQKFCEENVERIAWEVIPDLAENLIKRELEEVSSKVLEE